MLPHVWLDAETGMHAARSVRGWGLHLTLPVLTCMRSVHSVEHLLSALECCGVDNARIEMEGGYEVPVTDGSAQPWAINVVMAGLQPAHAHKGRGKPPVPQQELRLQQVPPAHAVFPPCMLRQAAKTVLLPCLHSSCLHAMGDAVRPCMRCMFTSGRLEPKPCVVRCHGGACEVKAEARRCVVMCLYRTQCHHRSLFKRNTACAQAVHVQEGDAFVAFYPLEGRTRLSAGLDASAEAAIIGKQWFSFDPAADEHYRWIIAPARTFYRSVEVR